MLSTIFMIAAGIVLAVICLYILQFFFAGFLYSLVLMYDYFTTRPKLPKSRKQNEDFDKWYNDEFNKAVNEMIWDSKEDTENIIKDYEKIKKEAQEFKWTAENASESEKRRNLKNFVDNRK